MSLTDKAIRATKAGAKPLKLFDGGGLHLLVTPAGGKLWRLKYRIGGRENQLAIGRYPAVSLADARIAREEARAALRSGQDPGAAKRLKAQLGAAKGAAETFEALARDWHARNRPKWAQRHGVDVLGSLERLVFPAIGGLHVNAVTPPLALAVIRQVEQNQGGETARKMRQRMSAVFVYAIAHGIGQTDPAAIVRGAMAPAVKGRMPAVTTLDAARGVLAQAEAIPAHPVTRAAHRFLALTLVRPDNVNGARWDEFEPSAETPRWAISAERMKMREPHVVPLSRQAIEILEAVRPLTGRCPFVFPNARFSHRPMSENAMSYLLARAGLAGVQVPHGWRATFSTIMNELHPADADAIERVLAHVTKGVRGIYARGAYLERRRELLQEWADLLLTSAASAEELIRGPRRPTRV
jgi:integrase